MIEADSSNDQRERVDVYSTKYNCIVIASIKTLLYITTEQLGVDTYPGYNLYAANLYVLLLAELSVEWTIMEIVYYI